MPSNQHSGPRRHEPHPEHYNHKPHLRVVCSDSSLASSASPSARDTSPLGVFSIHKREPSPHALAPTASASSHDRSNHSVPSVHNGSASHDPDDSFLDSHIPVDADMAEQHVSRVLQQRDSHDLSLSPRNVTRDSLVTNMLMSLDQFSMGHDAPEPQYDEDDESPRFFDVPRYRSNNDITTQANNWQQRGHKYSYSSDYDGPVDDDSGRGSQQYSRGRRSNSSNTPQEFVRSNDNRPPLSRGNHVRVGSRGSSLGSIDHTLSHPQSQSKSQVQSPTSPKASHRSKRGYSGSASIDRGSHKDKQQAYTPLEDVPSSPFRTDFINGFLDDEFTAPTPTVHSGPRRTPSTPTIPKPPPEPKERPSTNHRNRSSSRSVKSSSGRSKAANTREPAPPMPATPVGVDLESAPAPNVGYGKPKEPAQNTTAAAPAQPKERPGFFKRVFGGGSSKNVPSPTVDSNNSSRLGSADKGLDSPSANKPQSSPAQTKTISAPPSRDTTSSHSNHPTLQKKSSSFFRRRKKSVADEAPPLPVDAPPVPALSKINVEKDKFVPMAEPSPVSSLRQVMNPYLNETAPGSPMIPGQKASSALADITNANIERTQGANAREDFKREFSPDYEPSPNARIRKVNSNLENDQGEEQTPSKKPAKRESAHNTFLLDGGSDNDEEPTATQKEKTEVKEKKERREPKKDDTLRPKKKRSSKKLPTQSGNGSNLGLPLEGAQGSGSTTPRSKVSTPNLRIDTAPDESSPTPKVMSSLQSLKDKPLDEPEFVVGEPTEDDRSKAQKIYDGNEDFIQKGKAAAWMGEEGPVRQRTLQAYMELYDFANQSVVQALRQICGRLVFRAETQQVDRILVAFSKRWCACNPHHGFKATDVIHTICYSIMLLNTDLHMADIEQKMTRSQFVKNTMSTIISAVEEAAPDAFERRPSVLTQQSLLSADDPVTPTPTEERKSFRHSFRPPPRTDTSEAGTPDVTEDCGPLVKSSYTGTIKGWEEQVEIVLKTIYSSIRDERLPLFGADPSKSLPATPSGSSLSVMGLLKRTPSVLSKAPSEGNLSARGRVVEGRANTSRWTSKSRSRPGIGRAGFNSSRTSFDDSSSMWSPPLSSSATWSRQSLSRTQGSISQDSLGSHMPRADYQQSIGFANALSQAIIRDEDVNGNESAPSILSADFAATQLLEDESLELTGPPWVKEGMVIHKHHLDGVDKKAKERNWSEVFAVVQKGQMSLFSFSANKSTKQRNRPKASGPVGGGNWQDNATNVGTFNLRQTLASALPPPGYSRTRPHVWALSLPTGAVHLFQVGTPELIKEFVTTANYWSARLSTHPLVGGISNIEYGWSGSIVNNSLVSAINDTASTSGRSSRPGSAAAHGRKSSVSSFRSASIDQAAAAFTNATGRGKLPGDRIHIAEWAPPGQSLRPSHAGETEQLETLQAYVKGIEDELQAHNQLRSPMLLAYTPRGHNAGKAMANWERKSAYLLREIVKFRTYVDCLTQAENRKQEIYAERDLAQRAARGELTDGDMEVSGGDGEEEEEVGDETLKP